VSGLKDPLLFYVLLYFLSNFVEIHSANATTFSPNANTQGRDEIANSKSKTPRISASINKNVKHLQQPVVTDAFSRQTQAERVKLPS
jgi:Holliday junction resolvasome RuvABC ATP-dependent DNA helicase subunit